MLLSIHFNLNRWFWDNRKLNGAASWKKIRIIGGHDSLSMCAWNSSPNTLLISAYLMALDGNKRILKWIYLFSATSKLPWNNKNSYPLQHYFYSMKSLDFWVPTTLFFKKFLCPLPPTTIFWVKPPPPYNILDNNTAPPNFKNGTALS